MAALESDPVLRGKLSAIGLEPMADWVKHRCQSCAIPGWIIVMCAAMLTNHLDMVPRSNIDLHDTPYLETEDIADNLDDNGCVHYRDMLEPLGTLRFLAPEVMAHTAEVREQTVEFEFRVCSVWHWTSRRRH